mmetsp:Transcript_7074/g.17842  ORF Transcript_7074/g.17842 Transcript_7074/m.17842 type:complete len:347 (+) Transcript_7074:1398-2438(+)
MNNQHDGDRDFSNRRPSDEWTSNPLQLAHLSHGGGLGNSLTEVDLSGSVAAHSFDDIELSSGGGGDGGAGGVGGAAASRSKRLKRRESEGPSFMTRENIRENKHRKRMRKFVFSSKFTCFFVVVTLIDVTVSITDMIASHNKAPDLVFIHKFTYYVTFVCLILYVTEIILKILGCGFRVYVRDKWNWFDVFIVLLSAVFVEDDGGAVMISRLGKGAGRSAKLLQGFSRIVRICRICGRIRNISARGSVTVRHAVSKNKQRYVDVENNFDLDLTYITGNVVAMGVPAVGIQGFFRNPYMDVSRFFNERHPQMYRIYNCCPEMPYPEKPFRHQVVHFQIKVRHARVGL